MPFNIAIDGPAGAGKTTTAKQIAKRLGYIYADTGAMYRAVGLYFIRKGFDLRSITESDVSDNIHGAIISFSNGSIHLGSEDVSGLIRTDDVSQAASIVSAFPICRQYLLEAQRDIGRKNDCVMEGRDIGTIVLPDADLKIYLTASIDARAARRYHEEAQKDADASYHKIRESLLERDYRDTHRETAPLKLADGSYYIDNTCLSISQTADIVEGLAFVKMRAIYGKGSHSV